MNDRDITPTRRAFLQLGACGLIAPLSAHGQEAFRISYAWPPAPLVERSAQLFADRMRREANLAIDAFAERERFDPVQVYRALQRGDLGGWLGSRPATDVDGRLRVFEVPFLIGDTAHLKRVYRALIAPPDPWRFSEQRITLLSPVATGAHGIIARKPVSSAGDLKGVKLASFGGDIVDRAWQEIGASPLRLSVSDFYPAASAGAIDAIAAPIWLIERLRLYEPFTVLTVTRHIYETTFFLISDRLKTSTDYDFVGIGHHIADFSVAAAEHEDLRAIRAMQQYGLTVYEARDTDFEYLSKITFDLFLSEVPEGWEVLRTVQDLGFG